MTRIIGICGSLRAASLNRALLRACAGLLPAGATLEVVEIGDLPLMNEDLEKPAWPEAVQRLRRAVWPAEALLIACPEYNAGIPAPLKNAIDWLSRAEGIGGVTAPPGETRRTPLAGLPTAIIGASPGMLGTARAQQHLRMSLQSTGTPVMPGPEAFVSAAPKKFEGGELIDEPSRAAVTKVLAGLVGWAARLKD
ncbi:NADPH-dependent FMN reductase [Falsiroseomonas tokyonensis]|uniref:NADPH-dependent FMN reductase n=1 Tax=Falsiroseomonas tokyonensis TaxID=430521 RepID=A0ABV7BSD9_9PROT|nr:NAD(P)H-dependent oxidoreductase [Falsiroseomonas tokyonensis]